MKFDFGIGHLVPNASDSGPCAFPVQSVSLGILTDFNSYFEEGRRLMGRQVYGSAAFQALVWSGGASLFSYMVVHYVWDGLVKGFGWLLAMALVVAVVFTGCLWIMGR